MACLADIVAAFRHNAQELMNAELELGQTLPHVIIENRSDVRVGPTDMTQRNHSLEKQGDRHAHERPQRMDPKALAPNNAKQALQPLPRAANLRASVAVVVLFLSSAIVALLLLVLCSTDRIWYKKVALCLCTALVAFVGSSLSLLGPTLLAICWLVGTTWTGIGSMLAVRACGFCCGSLVIGAIFDQNASKGRFTSDSLLIASALLFGSAVTLGNIYAWISEYILFMTVSFLHSVAVAGVDACAQLFVISINLQEDHQGEMGGDHESLGVHLHVIHVGYGVGSVLAPFIISPLFVGGANSNNQHEVSFCGSGVSDDVQQLPLINFLGTLPSVGLCVCSFLALIPVSGRRREGSTAARAATTPATIPTIKQQSSQPPCGTARALAAMFLFMFAYTSAETCFISYVSTYAQLDLGFSASDGSLLTSLFGVGNLIGNGVGVATFWYWRDKKMRTWCIRAFLAAEVASAFALVFFSDSRLVFAVFTTLLGVAVGPVFASASSWYLVNVSESNFHFTVLVVAVCCGDAVVSAITGFAFLIVSPSRFPVIILVVCLCSALAWIVVEALAPTKATNTGQLTDGYKVQGDKNGD